MTRFRVSIAGLLFAVAVFAVVLAVIKVALKDRSSFCAGILIAMGIYLVAMMATSLVIRLADALVGRKS